MRQWATIVVGTAVALVVLGVPVVGADGDERQLPERVIRAFTRPADYRRPPRALSRAAQTTVDRLKEQHKLRAELPERPSDEEQRDAAEQVTVHALAGSLRPVRHHHDR